MKITVLSLLGNKLEKIKAYIIFFLNTRKLKSIPPTIKSMRIMACYVHRSKVHV